jgi:hypothetical protein
LQTPSKWFDGTGRYQPLASQIPPGLCRLVQAREALRAHRLNARRLANRDAELRGYSQPQSVALLCNGLLHKKCGVPPDVHCSVHSAGTMSSFTLKRGPQELFRSAIDWNWTEEVYRRGFGVVGGALTLSYWGNATRGKNTRLAAIVCRWRPNADRNGNHVVMEYVNIRPAPTGKHFAIVA